MTNDRKTRYPLAAHFVERVGHPVFLAGALGLWWLMGGGNGALFLVLVLSLFTMEVIERSIPALPTWRQSGAEKLGLIGVYLLGLLLSGMLIASYEAVLAPLFDGFNSSLGARLWPQSWPVFAQMVILFFASDFIYYWIHRAIHRSSLLWRLTGHGFHHGFHNLHAINSGASHPFELVFLALPLVLLSVAFMPPAEAVSGAGLLLIVNAIFAHANVKMETPGFSWVVTASNHHRRHHSVVFEESNTNYACNAIIWDRLFGTYSSGAVRQTGIGPRQPALWRMFLLPFREPDDADTVAKRTATNRPEVHKKAN